MNKLIKKILIKKALKNPEIELKKEKDKLEIKAEKEIMELKKIQTEKMLQLNRFAEFGRLSSGFFHEFINSLTAISLHIEQVKNGSYKKLKETKQYLARAINTSEQMKNFLMMARKRIAAQEDIKLFSVEDEIKQVVKVLAYKARKANVCINFNPSVNIKIYGDAIKFSQVVINLVLNAADAYPDADEQIASRNTRREVLISLDKNKSGFILNVEDWGRGISGENVQKIFEQFFTTKDFSEGAGVGLFLVKNIVEKDFEGTIKLISNNKKGTIFSVAIPIKK
ncbi:HAMP domain-containing histidine kinase [Candidatus Parcubacteria bacterium]|nr:HAMP domain-containing histidine kinase [Candidatus Parcubacteria bacterium]